MPAAVMAQPQDFRQMSVYSGIEEEIILFDAAPRLLNGAASVVQISCSVISALPTAVRAVVQARLSESCPEPS